MNKKYVKVILEIDENGKKTPKTIVYNDKEYSVDRVIDIRPCVSMKVRGIGERYTVRIGGKETYIFFENNKWFVEEK